MTDGRVAITVSAKHPVQLVNTGTDEASKWLITHHQAMACLEHELLPLVNEIILGIIVMVQVQLTTRGPYSRYDGNCTPCMSELAMRMALNGRRGLTVNAWIASNSQQCLTGIADFCQNHSLGSDALNNGVADDIGLDIPIALSD